MRPHTLALAALLLAAPSAAFAACTPAICPGAFHGVTFETFAPGSVVEGLAAVDPDLRITSVAWAFGPGCPTGTSRVIEEGNTFPYSSYSTGVGVSNGCLDGVRGMGHPANCVLDYDFTFAPGVTVGCFAIKLFDFGDYYPYGGALHGATLTAYNASNAVVAVGTLSGAAAVDSTSGDACLSQAGLPGNFTFSLAGAGITRVELRFGPSPDPNIGFDSIAFCETSAAVDVRRRTWGTLKTFAR